MHDHWGFSLGVNLNRYLGVELSGDFFERDLDVSPYGRIGEYGVFALVPQVRLRYPLLDDRLTPYLVAGAGVAFTQFNDRKPKGFGLSVQDETATFVGTIGAGIEYFFADNLAVGVEVKYLIAANQKVTVNGTSHTPDIDSLFTTLALRVFYPELRPAPAASQQAEGRGRVYLGVEVGGAVPLRDKLASGVEANPEPPAYADTLNQYFAASVGLDLGRYLGVEVWFGGYETRIADANGQSLAEYATFAAIPQLRLRYPLLDGRLVPYVLAGVGAGFSEVNDKTAIGAAAGITGDSVAFAASGAIGAEYFVMNNVAVGAQVRYLHTTGKIDLAGQTLTTKLDAMLFSGSLRIYLAGFALPRLLR